MGKRSIDAPIRLIAVVLAVITLLSGNQESSELLYLLLQFTAGGLVLLAAWAPATAGALATAGLCIDALLYPEFLSGFFLPIAVAASICLSYRRYASFLACSAGLGLGLAVSSVLETADAEYAMLATEGSLWLFAALLGVSTAMLQARIDREIVQRESTARRSEQEVQRIRLDLATDAHDTVSHALATEAAIIRVMGDERGEGLDERVLSELALVNARAQRQLRQLLTRLNSPIGAGFGVDLAREIDATLTAIRGGSRAGGFDIAVSTGRLPGRVDIRFAEAVQFMLFELATNILKHASAPDFAEIHVGLEPADSGDELILSSRNLAAVESKFVPSTLDRRSRGSGGTCSVSCDTDGCVTVEVVLPLADGGSMADFIRTDEAQGSAAVVDSLHAHDGDSVHGFSPAVRGAFGWWRAHGPRPGSGS